MESTSAEDDDEIVLEVPICHATRLQKRLYSFRYPLVPKSCRNEMSFRRGFFKPQNQEAMLELSINVESPNFDADRAELIAEEADGPADKRKAEETYFENDIVDKVCLKSMRPIKEASKYAAMVFTGTELHLTTLNGVFEFRPSFPYLENTGGKKRKGLQNDMSDSDSDEAGPSTAAPEAVHVRFKKQSDDRWKKNKGESSKTVETQSANEPWTKCAVVTQNSTLSKVEKLKLLAENTQETHQANVLTDAEYLRVLVPEDQEQATIEPSLPSDIMSLHALRALSIDEQCRLLLKDAQIIQFQQLFMILAGGEGLTAETLLKSLPKVAVLVRGNWVVKSDVLYPKNTFSKTSGVPAESMCRTRDYVLYLFTKNQYVERKKVSSTMKIPSEEVKEIFTGFSRLSHNKGWELLLPQDVDFISKHADIVNKQRDEWEKRFKQLSEFLQDNKRQRRKSKSCSESDNKAESSGGDKNKSPIAARKKKTAPTTTDC